MDSNQLSNAITECYNIINNFIQRTEDIRLRDARDIIREIERIEREYNDAVKRLPLEYFDFKKRLGEVKLGDIELQGTKFGEIELSGTVGSNNISPHKKLEEIELGGKKLTEYSLDDIAFSGTKLEEIIFDCSKLSDAKLGETTLGQLMQDEKSLKEVGWKEVKLKFPSENKICLGDIMLGNIKFEGIKLGQMQLAKIKVCGVKVEGIRLHDIVTGKKLNEISCVFSGEKQFKDIKLSEIKSGNSQLTSLIPVTVTVEQANGNILSRMSMLENAKFLDMSFGVGSSLLRQINDFCRLRYKIEEIKQKDWHNYVEQIEALIGALKGVRVYEMDMENFKEELRKIVSEAIEEKEKSKRCKFLCWKHKTT